MAMMNVAAALMGLGGSASQNGTARPAPRLRPVGKTPTGQPILPTPQQQAPGMVRYASGAGGLGQMLGAAARGVGPAMTGMANGAGAAVGQALANPNAVPQMLNQGPNRQPQAAGQQKPGGPVYSANFNTNIMPLAQQGINQQQGLQNYAAQNAVGETNAAFWGGGGSVSGPLQGVYSNPVAPGSAQGAANSPAQAAALGQWQANFNNAPKAQQTIGAMGDVGDARWNAQMAPGATYTDQGRVLGNGSAGGAGGAAGGAGAGGGGTGTGTPIDQMVQNLINEYQSAHDARNAEADASRAAGMKNYEDQRTRAMNDMQGFGRAQTQEIRDQARQAKGTLAQSMAGRGLSNTSSNPVLQNAIDKNARKSMVGLGDSLTRQRLDVDQQTTSNINNWLLANAPEGPQMGELAQLLQGLGASGYGQPMGGAGDLNVPDISNLLKSLFGGNPYAQNLGNPFPQGAQGRGGQQGQRGPVGQPQQQQGQPQQPQGGRDFEIDGRNNASGYYTGWEGSALPGAVAGGLGNFIQGKWGDPGSAIINGTSQLSDYLFGGSQGYNWGGVQMPEAYYGAISQPLQQLGNWYGNLYEKYQPQLWNH